MICAACRLYVPEAVPRCVYEMASNQVGPTGPKYEYEDARPQQQHSSPCFQFQDGQLGRTYMVRALIEDAFV